MLKLVQEESPKADEMASRELWETGLRATDSGERTMEVGGAAPGRGPRPGGVGLQR